MTTLGVVAIAAAGAVTWWPVARAVARRVAGGAGQSSAEARETAARLAALERRLDALAAGMPPTGAPALTPEVPAVDRPAPGAQAVGGERARPTAEARRNG